jgi:endonuclease/exonuclease/phosphatase family metal-dependent hydrolase
MLLGWPLIGRNVQLFDKKLPADKEQDWNLKVLSYNVQAFAQQTKTQPNGNTLNLFDYLREKDPDLLCIQEFIASSSRKEMKIENIYRQFDELPYHHVELTAFGQTGNHYSYGIATFSKYPIIREKLIFSDNTTNACMYSDLLIGADTVRVFNIHLKSVSFQNDDKLLLNNVVKREYGKSDLRAVLSIFRQISKSSFKRAKQVEIVYSHIIQSPYPVIICGDFNDPPTSYTYKKIRGVRKDAFVEAGSGRSATFNIGRIASLRIDFIMYSDVFKAYDYESPRVYLSDHYPVMCRLVKR